MAVTTHYLCIIRYDRGTAEIPDEYLLPLRTLDQVVLRATCIPGHRILIEAHEDPADPCEVGAARRRLDTLRHHLVAQSIDAHRLEMQVHGTYYCQAT